MNSKFKKAFKPNRIVKHFQPSKVLSYRSTRVKTKTLTLKNLPYGLAQLCFIHDLPNVRNLCRTIFPFMTEAK